MKGGLLLNRKQWQGLCFWTGECWSVSVAKLELERAGLVNGLGSPDVIMVVMAIE